MRFRLSHPTLVIIILGFILVVRGSPDSQQAEGPNQEASTKASGGNSAGTAKSAGETAPAGNMGSHTNTAQSSTRSGGADGATAKTKEAPAKGNPPGAETAPAPEPPSQASNAAVLSTPAWVYLGSAKGGSLTSQTFGLTQFPVPGQEIEALMPVHERETAPTLREDEKWYFGRVVGVLEKGERVSVRRLTTVHMSEDEPEYIWAEVGEIPKPAQ